MTVAIIRFGGSNCDRDAERALEHLEVDAEIVWHEDGLPEDTTGVVLPGGFSYGDYLRAGAMAARSPILEEVREAAADGVPVLGVCNGAQIGCESGLTEVRSPRTRARASSVNTSTCGSNATTRGGPPPTKARLSRCRSLTAKGATRSTTTASELEADDRILFRYCDADGKLTGGKPNGSKTTSPACWANARRSPS